MALCYQLADRYHQHPRAFLADPIDEVIEHARWTRRIDQDAKDR